MSEKILGLARLAADERTPENERNAAARQLARLICRDGVPDVDDPRLQDLARRNEDLSMRLTALEIGMSAARQGDYRQRAKIAEQSEELVRLRHRVRELEGNLEKPPSVSDADVKAAQEALKRGPLDALREFAARQDDNRFTFTLAAERLRAHANSFWDKAADAVVVEVDAHGRHTYANAVVCVGGHGGRECPSPCTCACACPKCLEESR